MLLLTSFDGGLSLLERSTAVTIPQAEPRPGSPRSVMITPPSTRKSLSLTPLPSVS